MREFIDHPTTLREYRSMTTARCRIITAMALQAFAPDMASFENGGHFAAWLGLVPN